MPPTESTSDLSRPPPGIDCDEAARLTRSFATGQLEVEALRGLRRHLARCGECMALYREALETTAQLGRLTVEERERRLLERQRQALHAKAFGPREKSGRRARRFRLRMVLLPAFFIYLMTQIAGLGPPPARVELVAHSGHVTIDGRTVEPGAEAALVLPGRWVISAQGAQARLDGRTCVAQLEAETELLLESAKPVRFRLRRGGLQVDGDMICVTVLGLVEVTQGKGSLFLGDTGLRVEPESGTWKLFDRHGERSFPAGVQTVVEP
jgi:hypothetical protein